MKSIKKDKLEFRMFETRNDMGKAAADDIAACVNNLLSDKATINMVFAAAPSQNEVLAALALKNLPWERINAYHMDEYIGLSKEHPQSFGYFLKEHIFDLVPFKSVNYIADYGEKYAELLERNHIDIVVLGVGENGHIAFNDPGVADFNDSYLIKRAKLDDVCRMQQIHDGCFKTFDDVPKYALTMTIPQMISADYMFCVVPATTKADAVYKIFTEEPNEQCPATIMKNHDNAILYCENDSGSKIAEFFE